MSTTEPFITPVAQKLHIDPENQVDELPTATVLGYHSVYPFLIQMNGSRQKSYDYVIPCTNLKLNLFEILLFPCLVIMTGLNGFEIQNLKFNDVEHQRYSLVLIILLVLSNLCLYANILAMKSNNVELFKDLNENLTLRISSFLCSLGFIIQLSYFINFVIEFEEVKINYMLTTILYICFSIQFLSFVLLILHKNIITYLRKPVPNTHPDFTYLRLIRKLFSITIFMMSLALLCMKFNRVNNGVTAAVTFLCFNSSLPIYYSNVKLFTSSILLSFNLALLMFFLLIKKMS